MKRPSNLWKHNHGPRAWCIGALSLIDCAALHRDRGDRTTMRHLALIATAFEKSRRQRLNIRTEIQLDLF